MLDGVRIGPDVPAQCGPWGSPCAPVQAVWKLKLVNMAFSCCSKPALG